MLGTIKTPLKFNTFKKRNILLTGSRALKSNCSLYDITFSCRVKTPPENFS